MAIDLNAIRNRLDSLQTKTTKTDNLWKPKPGKQAGKNRTLCTQSIKSFH